MFPVKDNNFIILFLILAVSLILIYQFFWYSKTKTISLKYILYSSGIKSVTT